MADDNHRTSLLDKESVAIPRFIAASGLRHGRGNHQVDRLVTHSGAMKRVMATVAQYAPSQTAVLLRGEPGTGKDVIARAIHMGSQNRQGPFVKICCDYLDDEQAVMELFGCEAGFAQGSAPYPGDIALAEGGTLFISEIGNFSMALQKRLLRILQDNLYKPQGAASARACRVRIVCASEKNLEEMLLRGLFLAELYYRIHIATLDLPPLRERKEDIPGLVAYFLERYNCLNGLSLSIDPAALAPFYLCQWPGNVRDLENCLEHAALQTAGGTIKHLPCLSGGCVRQRLNQKLSHQQEAMSVPDARLDQGGRALPLWRPLPASPVAAVLPRVNNGDSEELRYRLLAALERSGGVKAKAARLLNITPRQLFYAIKKLDIEVKKF